MLEQVGPLDERFGLGLFEDDDWAMRVRLLGLRLVVAEDVVVHHHGEGSFGALVAGGEHARLFARNKATFEAKWQQPWQPHAQRPEAGYLQQTRRVCALVRSALPPDAAVLVVSKGDEALLRLDRTAGHFPQDATGEFAGHYPADSAQAVDALEVLVDKGFGYLVLPTSAAWWLEHYAGLARHLQDSAEVVLQDPSCRIFRLRADRPAAVGS